MTSAQLRVANTVKPEFDAYLNELVSGLNQELTKENMETKLYKRFKRLHPELLLNQEPVDTIGEGWEWYQESDLYKQCLLNLQTKRKMRPDGFVVEEDPEDDLDEEEKRLGPPRPDPYYLVQVQSTHPINTHS